MAKWGEITCGSKATGDPRDDFTRTYIRDNCPKHVLEYVIRLENERDEALEKLAAGSNIERLADRFAAQMDAMVTERSK